MKKRTVLKRLWACLTLLLLLPVLALPAFSTAVNTEDDPTASEYYDGVYFDTEAWRTRPYHAYWTDEIRAEAQQYGRSTLYALMNCYYAGNGEDRKGDGTISNVHTGLQTVMATRVWSDQDWNIKLKREDPGTDTDELVYTAQVRTGDTINVAAYDIRAMNAYAISKRNADPYMAKNSPEYRSDWTNSPDGYFTFYTNIRAVYRNGSWIDDAEEYVWPTESGDAAVSSWEYTVQEGDGLIYADAYARVIYRNFYTEEERTVTFLYRYAFTVTDSGFLLQTETTAAPEDPGEDEGTEVDPGIVETPRPTQKPAATPRPQTGGTRRGPSPEEIAISVGGALAAAGALGAATGGGKKDEGEEDAEEKKTRYRMYVYKDFGDAIQKGGQPVKVCARVSQILEGKEYDCPEQTAKIQVSGRDLAVRTLGVEGAYMAAEVRAEANTPQDKGAVIFTLTGPGGVFRKEMVFRLVEEPRIVFPGTTADGRWDLSVRNDTAQLVAGVGGEARLRFVILDAPEEPKEIRFGEAEGLSVTAERDERLRYTYWARIDNRTAPLEKAGGIFAEKEERQLSVEALFPDGRRIREQFTAELYPDGLCVQADKDRIKNGRLVVDTLEDPDAKEGYAKIPPVYFDFTVCWLEEATGEYVILKNPSFNHEKPTDNGKYGLLFSDNFACRLSHMGTSGVALFPLNTLPSLPEPYEASMKLIYDKDGKRFEADLPMGVLGERPGKPSSAELEEAIRALQKDIRTFGLGGDPQLAFAVRHAREMSPAQVEDIRKAVIEAGICFYEDNGKAQQAYGDLLTKYIVVAGTLVKAGDYALEVAMKRQFGGYGSIAAKFINPLKNLLATYIGEYYANGSLDQAPDFLETVLKSCEEALSAAITGVFFGDDIKGVTKFALPLGKKSFNITGNAFEEVKNVLGYVVAAYLLTSFARHYNYGSKGEKGDVFRSALAACADLGYEGFKAWLMNFIGKYCQSLFQKIGEAGGKVYKSFCQGRINEMAEKAGWQAFGDSVRGSLKYDLRGLTKESLDAARAAREAAARETKQFQEELIENTAKYLGKGAGKLADWAQDSPILGSILNYMAGGSREDESALGLTSSEVIFAWLTEQLGVMLDDVKICGERLDPLNPLDVTLRMEEGKIILGMLGHEAQISILENIAALSDLLFNTLFSWMEELLRYTASSAPDFAGVPDPRDRQFGSAEDIRRELEARRQRVENPDWRFRTTIAT